MSDSHNTSPQVPAAGWYPDPHDPATQRYWDGAQWTEHTAATAGAVPPSQVTAAPADAVNVASGDVVSVRRGLPKLKWWQWGLVALGAIVLISIIVNGENGGRAASDVEPTRPAVDSAAPQQSKKPSAKPVDMVEVPHLVGSTVAEARAKLEAVGLVMVPGEAGDDWIVTAQQPARGSHPAEGLELSVTTEAPKPVYTLAQKNAIGKAQSYLNYSGFSRSGLIGQLEYEGYSTDDATFGADNAGADWNAEAAEKAASYLKYSSFSRDGLYGQLEYEGFTPEQIAFGLAAVGY